MKTSPLIFLSSCAFAVLFTLGCDEPEETEAPSAEMVACTDYCDAAKKVGCPRNDTCIDECLSTFDLGCEGMLIDLLECMRPALADDCVPRSENGQPTCAEELHAHNGCVPAHFGPPDAECTVSAAMSAGGGDVSCEGKLICDGVSRGVLCDEEGVCTCLIDDEPIATCGKNVLSAYLCAPHASCCTALFDAQ